MPPRSNRPMNPQTQWKDQASSSLPQNSNEPTYTLPGVINYLTSEFTNLERFKIMTNLEKSEMKYRILHLEGEIKTLKYANQKQQAKLDSLEKENMLLKSKSKGETTREDVKEESDYPVTPSEPDLEAIKKSRQQLKDSMKEIISLLRSPSSRLGELNISEENHHEIEEMIENSEDDFVFAQGSNSPKSNIISRFFDDDIPEQKEAEQREVEQKELDKSGADHMELDRKEETLERSLTNESEMTVIDTNEEEESIQPETEAQNEDISKTRTFDHDGVIVRLSSVQDRVALTQEGNSTTGELTLSRFDEIQNIFVLPNGAYLIIGKDINLFSKGGDEKMLIPTKSSFSQVNTSSLIDMTTPDDKGKTFGLVIAGFSNGTKSFLSKVYQISIDEQVKHKEVGSFNRKFFSKIKGGSDITFMAWNRETIKSSPSSPNKNGSKNSADSRLKYYDLTYKVGDQYCRVNLASKQLVD